MTVPPRWEQEQGPLQVQSGQVGHQFPFVCYFEQKQAKRYVSNLLSSQPAFKCLVPRVQLLSKALTRAEEMKWKLITLPFLTASRFPQIHKKKSVWAELEGFLHFFCARSKLQVVVSSENPIMSLHMGNECDSREAAQLRLFVWSQFPLWHHPGSPKIWGWAFQTCQLSLCVQHYSCTPFCPRNPEQNQEWPRLCLQGLLHNEQCSSALAAVHTITINKQLPALITFWQFTPQQFIILPTSMPLKCQSSFCTRLNERLK